MHSTHPYETHQVFHGVRKNGRFFSMSWWIIPGIVSGDGTWLVSGNPYLNKP